MKRFFVLLTFGALVFSCQKEIHFDESNPSSVKCTACSYLPVCDSTKLTYIDSSALGRDTTESTLAILGDTTISGKKFTRVSPSAAFSQGLLYNCDGGNYRVFQPVPDLGIDVDSLFQSFGLPISGITIPSHIETTILKSNAAVNSTWTDTVFQFATFPFFTGMVKMDYKVEQKGVQHIVLGKTYNNVIQVSSKLNVVIPFMPPLPFEIRVDYYFAEGIGIIETRTTNNGVVEAYSKLYQYKIK